MLTVFTRTLNILAALVWYVGGIVLLLKAVTGGEPVNVDGVTKWSKEMRKLIKEKIK